MGRVLIVYGTNQGHTEKVAQHVQHVGAAHGHTVGLLHGKKEVPPDFTLAGFDGVVLCASVHEGKHQRYMRDFARRFAAEAQRLPSVFISVSLAQMDPRGRGRDEATRYIAEFLRDTGWAPNRAEPIAGALAYSRYNFLTRWLMRLIAKRQGGPTDTTRDYDFTDWEQLTRVADDFFAALPGARPRRPPHLAPVEEPPRPA